MTCFEFLALFNNVCLSLPDKKSIICLNDDGSAANAITFSQLHSLSEEIAKHFFNHTRAKNSFIGLHVRKGPWLIALILGIWRSGNAAAMLNNIDEFSSHLNVSYILSEENSDRQRMCHKFSLGDSWFFVYTHKESSTLDKATGMCFALTTSGSTGVPKAVRVPWDCIYTNVLDLQEYFCLSDSDTILSMTPTTFDPFFVDLFLSLCSGASLVITGKVVPLQSLFRKWDNTSEIVSGHSEQGQYHWKPCNIPMITFLQTTPSVYRHVLDGEKYLLSGNSSLKILVLGGEPFPKLIQDQIKSKTRIFNIYGITELSCWAFLHELTDFNDKVPLGLPLKYVKYKIKDGQLQLGSERRICLIDGENSSKLPLEVYRDTEDLVYFDDGNRLCYKCRANRIGKKFGVKINLVKIENLLYELDFIEHSVVLLHSDSLIWFVKLKTKNNGENRQKFKLLDVKHVRLIKDHIFTKLQDIEKPDLIIELLHIPLSKHGKLDHEKLIQIRQSLKLTNPRDIFQFSWCQMLNLNQPETNKSFFESGGTSFLAASILAQLENPPQELMAYLLTNRTYEECLSLFDWPTCKKRKFEDEIGRDMLEIAWTFDMGKCVDASPTIFQCNSVDYVVVGSHSSQISSLRCDNGELSWTNHLPDRIESGVCASADNSKLVVGCYDGCIYCLSSINGQVLWNFPTGDMVKSTAKLSICGLFVYFGSYDMRFYCLRIENGALVNSRKISNAGIFSSAAVTKDCVFVATLDGTCVCLRTNCLTELWRRNVGSPVFSSPCLLCDDRKVVFAEVKGRLHCFNTADGAALWTLSANGNIFSTPTHFLHKNKSLLAFGCHDSHLYHVDVTNNPEILWKLELDSPVYSTPRYHKNNLICSSTSGFVYVVSLTGIVKAVIKLNGEVFSSPLGYSDRIFVGCRDNNIVCLKLKQAESK